MCFLRLAHAGVGVDSIAKQPQKAQAISAQMESSSDSIKIKIEFTLPDAEQPTKILLHCLDGRLKDGIKRFRSVIDGKDPTPVSVDMMEAFRDNLPDLPQDVRAALDGKKIAFVQSLRPQPGERTPMLYVDSSALYLRHLRPAPQYGVPRGQLPRDFRLELLARPAEDLFQLVLLSCSSPVNPIDDCPRGTYKFCRGISCFME